MNRKTTRIDLKGKAEHTIAKLVKITYNIEKHSHMKHTRFQRLIGAVATCALLMHATTVHAAAALLVNTESFNTIEAGDGATDIELRFGATGKELRWSVGESLFKLDDSIDILGTASGRKIHAQDRLTSSGGLVIEQDAYFASGIVLNGVKYTFPYSDASASGRVLASDGSGQLSWTSAGSTPNVFQTIAVSGQNDVVTDTAADTLTFAAGTNVTITTDEGTDTITINATDNNTTYTAAQGLSLGGPAFSLNAALTGTSLEIFGTASGRVVHAQDILQSSGALAVETNGFFGGTLTTVNDITMGGGNLNFTESTTIGDGGDQLTIDSDGTLVINDGVLDFSAQTVDVTLNSAADAFNFDSNTLSIDAANNRVGINTAAPDTRLEIVGTSSGTIFHAPDRLSASGTLAVDGSTYFNTMSTCTLLTTVAGLLTCDTEGFDESVDDRVNALFRAGTGITLTYNDTGNTFTIEASHGSGNVVNLVPEFDGAVYYGSGAAGVGQLAYAFDSTNLHNYYRWTTSNAAIQDYWIAVRTILPKNFHAWDQNPIALNLRTDTTTTTNNHVTLRMIDAAGANVPLANVGGIASTSNDTWRKVIATGPESAGTFTAGSGITLLLKLATLAAAGAGYTDLGEIELNWSTNHP